MRSLILIISSILLTFTFIQCDRDSHMGSNQMGDQQMNRMMQNPEIRRGMMQRMANDPDMRREMMRQVRSGMGQMDQEAMLDRMEAMMQDPERKERMLTRVQNMQEMLEKDEFDREEMRNMMEQSPMMGMQMRCVQMMEEPGSGDNQE